MFLNRQTMPEVLRANDGFVLQVAQCSNIPEENVTYTYIIDDDKLYRYPRHNVKAIEECSYSDTLQFIIFRKRMLKLPVGMYL